MPRFKLFILLTNLARLLNYFKETEIIMSIFSFTNDKAAKFLLYGGFPSLAIYGYLYVVRCSVWQPWAATWQLSSGCRIAAKHCYVLQRAAQRFCSALQLNFSCEKTSKTLQIGCKSAVQPFRSAFAALHSAARFVRGWLFSLFHCRHWLQPALTALAGNILTRLTTWASTRLR